MALLQLLGQGMRPPSPPRRQGMTQVLARADLQVQLGMTTRRQLMRQPLDMHRASALGLVDGLLVQAQRPDTIAFGTRHLGLGQGQAITEIMRVELGPQAQAAQWFGVILHLTGAVLQRGTIEHAEHRQVDLMDMYRRAPGQLPGALQTNLRLDEAAFEKRQQALEQPPPEVHLHHLAGLDPHLQNGLVRDRPGTAAVAGQATDIARLDMQSALRIEELEVVRNGQAGIDLLQHALDGRTQYKQIRDDVIAGIAGKTQCAPGQAGTISLFRAVQRVRQRLRPDADLIQRQQYRHMARGIFRALGQLPRHRREGEARAMALETLRRRHPEPGQRLYRRGAEAMTQRQQRNPGTRQQQQVGPDERAGNHQCRQQGHARQCPGIRGRRQAHEQARRTLTQLIQQVPPGLFGLLRIRLGWKRHAQLGQGLDSAHRCSAVTPLQRQRLHLQALQLDSLLGRLNALQAMRDAALGAHVIGIEDQPTHHQQAEAIQPGRLVKLAEQRLRLAQVSQRRPGCRHVERQTGDTQQQVGASQTLCPRQCLGSQSQQLLSYTRQHFVTGGVGRDAHQIGDQTHLQARRLFRRQAGAHTLLHPVMNESQLLAIFDDQPSFQCRRQAGADLGSRQATGRDQLLLTRLVAQQRQYLQHLAGGWGQTLQTRSQQGIDIAAQRQ